jgi:hypothetical protein
MLQKNELSQVISSSNKNLNQINEKKPLIIRQLLNFDCKE